MIVNTDCKYYRGDIPCVYHKRQGVHCERCGYYEKLKERILIIKLGAIGDVIRTTPLLHKLKSEYPDAQIHWLTDTPEILPSQIDKVYRFDIRDIEILKSMSFHLLLNLDKDREACALANRIKAKTKKGFKFVDGHCSPIGNAAEAKWITGLFDDVNQSNTKSYLEEIFEICGYKFQGEEYIFELHEKAKNWDLKYEKSIIGLNTGCGERWQTRLWPETHWIELAMKLIHAGYEVLFLGGEQEHKKNLRLAKKTGGLYKGYYSLDDFIGLMNQCDLVVTAVTMALHIAIGLKKKIVLFNNIFNKNEFELYGHGVIIEPDKGCKGCFKNVCDEACMEMITPEMVFENINCLMK